MKKHSESFPRLDHYVQNGFNILLYGLGSKKRVLEQFGLYLSRKVGEMPALLVVHGYSPCFSLRQFIESVAERYFGLKSFPVGMKSALTKCRYLVELSKAVATALRDTQGKILEHSVVSLYSCQCFTVKENVPVSKEQTPAYSQPCFNYIWDALRAEGWQHFKGVGLSSYYYAMPNVSKKAEGTIGEDMFRSELEVYAFCAANRKEIFEEATRYAAAQQHSRRSLREESSPSGKKEPAYFTRSLYILFHSIDGENARTQEVQMALSMLAESPRIHFIASVDHMNAPLVWNNQQADRFNWLWIEAVTFEPLFSETRDTEAISTTKQARAAVGTSYVLKSLTPNHLRVLQELAKYQLKQKEEKEMEFSLLLERCTAEMYVNNENGLRTLLVEMTDHELVKSRRDSNDVEKLRICLTDAEIRAEILKTT